MTDFRPGRFQVLPSIVKNIIIINVLVVLLQFVLGQSGIDIADYFGLHYWSSHYFRPWQLLTHMFMHGSVNSVQETIMHIFFNMFALWMFGSILENVWGPKRFLIFYIICGIGAALCHMGVLTYQFEKLESAFQAYQAHPSMDAFKAFIQDHLINNPTRQTQSIVAQYNQWASQSGFDANLSSQLIHNNLHGFTYQHQYIEGLFDEATVGASGAVFGVLFAFGYMFPNMQLMLIFPPIPVKAKWVVTVYALFELYAGFRNSAGDNVAHFAHLGGMLFAFILLKAWGNRNRNRFYP